MRLCRTPTWPPRSRRPSPTSLGQGGAGLHRARHRHTAARWRRGGELPAARAGPAAMRTGGHRAAGAPAGAVHRQRRHGRRARLDARGRRAATLDGRPGCVVVAPGRQPSRCSTAGKMGVLRLRMVVDTGVDDALALVAAVLHPGLDVVEVVAAGGNVARSQCAANTRFVLGLLGVPAVPVTAGADRRADGLAYAGRAVHGPDGLAGLAPRGQPGSGCRAGHPARERDDRGCAARLSRPAHHPARLGPG